MQLTEFLAWEAQMPRPNEFLDGVVRPREPATEEHAMTNGNVLMVLRRHLLGSRCRVYGMQLQVLVEPAGACFYPDVFVTCSETDRKEATCKREPLLVVEVLSPSTAAHDRGAKFAAYRRAASLKEYALVDPGTRTTDVYRQREDGLWVLHPFGPDDTVEFASVALAMAPAELWAEVPPPERATAGEAPAVHG